MSQSTAELVYVEVDLERYCTGAFLSEDRNTVWKHTFNEGNTLAFVVPRASQLPFQNYTRGL
jgi:hypothetical protein